MKLLEILKSLSPLHFKECLKDDFDNPGNNKALEDTLRMTDEQMDIMEKKLKKIHAALNGDDRLFIDNGPEKEKTHAR